jgi:hypothetical protein
MPTRLLHLLILLLLLAAFALRLGHLWAGIFHIDEYISMLAAQMTVQKGAPILPSGLLYHQGLLLSYLAAPFIGLLGFREEIARWPSLLAGVLMVAVFYRVARQIFQSSSAGLLALTLATLDASMILWSARMRMYALAGLLMLLALYFLIQGTLLQPSRRHRLAAVICLVGAILTHSVAVVALPVWALALVICLVVGQRQFNLAWYRQKSIIPELALALLLLAVGVAFSIGGQIPFLSPGAAAASGGGDSGGSGLSGVFNKFLDPGISWARVDDFIYTYTSADYWPLLVLGGVSLGWALLAAFQGRLTRRDGVALLLGLIFLLTMAELGLALTSTWRKTRYLFILCHSPFLLLAADGLARIFEALARFLSSRLPISDQRLPTPSPLLPTTYYLLPILAIILFWAGPALEVAMGQGTGGYDTAFKWLKTQWQEGDRVMTVHPSAAYLYLGRSDYYATQGTARVLADEESEELVDRYVGSALVDSLDNLAIALSESKRLWFVVDTNRLFSRYEPLFTQQIFAQMNTVHQTGAVLVFLSQPYPQPVPLEPLTAVNVNFNDLVELGGYSLDLKAVTPDRTVQLGLYWRPQTSQFPKPYKVFVQLRNDQNQTVAQADHFIFEGLLTGAVLGQLKDQHEWLRDTADLPLPENLPEGAYRLLIGLYDPDTFERVPIVADTSGENAVILETISVP